jgi:acyl carrier protein
MGWIGRLTRGRTAATEAPPAATEPATARPLDAAGIRDDLTRHVVETSDGKLRAEAVEADAPLFDHGYVDSLTAVSLLEMIRFRYGVEVSEIDLVGRLNTLGALARHIAETSARTS